MLHERLRDPPKQKVVKKKKKENTKGMTRQPPHLRVGEMDTNSFLQPGRRLILHGILGAGHVQKPATGRQKPQAPAQDLQLQGVHMPSLKLLRVMAGTHSAQNLIELHHTGENTTGSHVDLREALRWRHGEHDWASELLWHRGHERLQIFRPSGIGEEKTLWHLPGLGRPDLSTRGPGTILFGQEPFVQS